MPSHGADALDNPASAMLFPKLGADVPVNPANVPLSLRLKPKHGADAPDNLAARPSVLLMLSLKLSPSQQLRLMLTSMRSL
jgi:hypothetical protein